MDKKTEILNRIYNLILDRNVREWERARLLQTRRAIESGRPLQAELSQLEVDFRPLAIRHNLTPLVTEFYKEISSQSGLFGRGLGKLFY